MYIDPGPNPMSPYPLPGAPCAVAVALPHGDLNKKESKGHEICK